jgi:TetR/AcrR family transcriptional regulator, mexJK operon transcriptional repressor
MAGMMEPIRERNEAPAGKVESILGAAKRTFLTGGYGAVSMDMIAREAAVSKATVYAHFGSKEELFGAVIGRECERYFARFSAGELDPSDVQTSLTVLGRRFLELVLSPDGIALHRILLGEVTRFPGLGEVFWRAGPERQRVQIEAFLRSAVACGTLSVEDTRLAAEQFVSLVRGDVQLRHLLKLEAEAAETDTHAAVEAAVDTFIRAFEPQATNAGFRATAERRGRGYPAPSPISPSSPSTMGSAAAAPRRRLPGSRRRVR